MRNQNIYLADLDAKSRSKKPDGSTPLLSDLLSDISFLTLFGQTSYDYHTLENEYDQATDDFNIPYYLNLHTTQDNAFIILNSLALTHEVKLMHHADDHSHDSDIEHYLINYVLLGFLLLLSIMMSVLICIMSTSIRNDILSMSKLLLLVEKGFFEIYKNKYGIIVEKISSSVKNKYIKEDEKNKQFTVSQDKLLVMTKENIDMEMLMKKPGESTSIRPRSYLPSMMGNKVPQFARINHHRRNLNKSFGTDKKTAKNFQGSELSDMRYHDNISDEIKGVFDDNKNYSSKNRYRTYVKPPKNDKALIGVLILVATIMIISPGLIDHFTHIRRLESINNLQIAALKANQLSSNVLTMQSLFQMELYHKFNEKSMSGDLSELIGEVKEHFSERITLQDLISDYPSLNQVKDTSICDYTQNFTFQPERLLQDSGEPEPSIVRPAF